MWKSAPVWPFMVPRPVPGLQEVWGVTPTAFIKPLLKVNHNAYLSSPTVILLLPPFTSTPGLLPVPGGCGRSGRKWNKITFLKYPTDPGVSFLGLLSPLHLNKRRVIRGGKGVQICSTWNYIHRLICKGGYKRKRRHLFLQRIYNLVMK